jgi:hypothetical protein
MTSPGFLSCLFKREPFVVSPFAPPIQSFSSEQFRTPPPLSAPIQLALKSCILRKQKKYRILKYRKLSMYFFYMALGLNDFDAGNWNFGRCGP